MEPPSGDDPAARLPHPQCSLWACRAAPSWWGVWSGESRHTTFRGPRGRPASLQAMGRSGRTTAVTGEALGGASGHAPSVNSPLAVRSGRGGPHQREAGEAGNWGIWTRPLIAGETREPNVVSPRGAQWSYRALPSPTREVGRGFRTLPLGATPEARAKRVETVAGSVPLRPGRRAGSLFSCKIS